MNRKEDERKETMTAIGARLRDVIKANGVSQSAFADECGISYETLRTYLKGNSFYRVDILIMASKRFNVSVDYLLCLNDENAETPISEIINRKTLLSKESIEKLIDMGMRNGQREKMLRETLELMILDTSLLNNIANYCNFIKNKNVFEGIAKDKYSFKHKEKTTNYIENEIEEALYGEPEDYADTLKKVDIENILLFQMIKKLDGSIKYKLSGKNSKRR